MVGENGGGCESDNQEAGGLILGVDCWLTFKLAGPVFFCISARRAGGGLMPEYTCTGMRRGWTVNSGFEVSGQQDILKQ